MAEVLGGIGETIDTTKFNGISNTKDETVPIKHEEVELSQHVTTQLPAQAYLGTQLSVQINAGTELSMQDSAGIQSSVQSNAGMQLLVQDKTGSQQQIKVKSRKKTEEEDEEEEIEENNNTAAEQEDSSPSDYEFSLREENIRLKSRLEQAKEGMSTLEKQCKKIKDELEKEKKFGDKANSTIYSLMQEKQSLMEKMKRSQPLNSAHTEGIQEVVRKLEHEIQVLEERLDSQRKRYHQEHVLMYEDLKEERIKRQEWKQTYLKSQVAVMAFRRKLTLMKDRVSEEDIKELSKCLELVFHEQDGHLKQDLITKKEEGCVEGKSKYATHISNMYKNSKEIPKVTDTVAVDANVTLQLPSKRVTELKDISSSPVPPQIISHKHSIADNERDDPSMPKVFIMDEDELIDPTTTKPSGEDGIVKLPPLSNTNPRMYSNSNQRYELDGSKHHHSFNQSGQQRQSHDRSPQYKHWHHYSVDNPGHNPGQNRKLDVLGSSDRIPDGDIGNKKSLVNTLQRIEDRSYKSKFSKYGFNDQLELNVNDTKFLELNFDQAFLKGTAPSKLPKSFQQKNGIREGPEKKSDEGKKLYCVTCDKEVPNRLCGHANIIIQEREREFPCPTCARVFTNRSHLKRHNMIHSGEKPFACTYCDKRFNRKSHLSRHLLTHTGEKPFKCPTCDKGFADNSDLKRHRQIHEVSPSLVPILPKENTNPVQPAPIQPVPIQPVPIQPNPIALTAITSISSTANAILTTISSVSSDPKSTFIVKKKELRYPCNKCGKLFSRKSHMTRHRLTHDKIKIYCDCGRLFRQNAHLQAHLPACIRKREAIEAKYLAECQMITQVVDLPPDAVKVEETLGDASCQSLADDSNSNIVIQSVDDFKARLNAKFNDGGNLNEIKSREDEISKLQSLQEKRVKEEALDEFSTEIDQSGLTAHPDSTDEGDHSSDGNLETKNMEVSSNENTSTNVNDDNDEKLFVVTSIPTDVVSNEYLNDNDTETKPLVTNLEQNTTEQNSHEDTPPEQKMSDINFNLIVKNGSSKLPNDDLALGVDSIPCLPIEIPPLLNE